MWQSAGILLDPAAVCGTLASSCYPSAGVGGGQRLRFRLGWFGLRQGYGARQTRGEPHRHGHHIGRPQDPNEGIRIIRSAIDRGITFMDNCWDYHNGESERRMGLALGDGYRKKVFLMTKFDGRTKDSTARQIDESLRRLQTDHVDLIQFHENIRMED